jgi:hypothetical protein
MRTLLVMLALVTALVVEQVPSAASAPVCSGTIPAGPASKSGSASGP